MPKLKTKSGAKKRFKVTARGMVLYQQSRKRHGMIKRTNKQIRQLRGTAVLFKTDGRQTRRHRARQAQKSVEGRQGLLRAAQEYHSHCKAGGREGKPIRLSRSQASQTHLPRALDPAAQRGSAALRAHLQPVHRRPRQGGFVGGPQGLVRSCDPRARGVCRNCREGQIRNRGVTRRGRRIERYSFVLRTRR